MLSALVVACLNTKVLILKKPTERSTLAYLKHRYENFRRNGMSGWARSQPRLLRPLWLIPCLVEYLAFSLLCLAGLVAVVVLMALVALLRLEGRPERPAR